MSRDLDDHDLVHIHDHRPATGGVARGVLIGLLMVGLTGGAYYAGSQMNRTVITAAARGETDATAPPKPIDMATGVDTGRPRDDRVATRSGRRPTPIRTTSAIIMIIRPKRIGTAVP